MERLNDDGFAHFAVFNPERDVVNIINLTPHTLDLQREDGSFTKIEPSGIICRVSETREIVNTLNGLRIERSKYGEIENLPEPKQKQHKLYSLLVLERIPSHRFNDVFSPGKSIRDDNGKIIGALGLSAR